MGQDDGIHAIAVAMAAVKDTGIGVRATIALLHKLWTTQPWAAVVIQFIEPLSA